MDLSKYTLKEIIKSKDEILLLKKQSFKNCDSLSLTKSNSVVKEDGEDDENVIKRTIIGNTYNWMDSHDDVHIDGVFTKTIKENGSRIMLLHDHRFEVAAKIGVNKKIYEQKIAWKDLGVNADGDTTSLLIDAEILRTYNENIFNQYKNGEITQHSVGMMYVKIFFATKEKSDKEGFSVWERYYDKIGNKKVADDKGYFFAVTEAKLREVSAVIAGSNELTGIYEPGKSTQNINRGVAEIRTITTASDQNKKLLINLIN